MTNYYDAYPPKERDKAEKNSKSEALKRKIAGKMGYPESFIDKSGGKKHHILSYRNSKTKKEYKGGVYGGMDIHEAMEYEERRKNKK